MFIKRSKVEINIVPEDEMKTKEARAEMRELLKEAGRKFADEKSASDDTSDKEPN